MTKIEKEIEALDNIKGNVFDELMWDEIHSRRENYYVNSKRLTTESIDYVTRRLYDVPVMRKVINQIEGGLK